MDTNDQLLLTVDEAAGRLRIGRSHFYNLVLRKEILSIKLGRSRRIPLAELERFVSERLEEETAGQAGGALEPR